MPIPALDENGFLPAGVHDASLDELRQRFGRFQETEKRVTLQGLLETFLTEARATGLVAAVIVNGSFTTAKARPSDIDLIVVLRQNHDYVAELRPVEYSVLSRTRVKARFPFDVVYVTEAPEILDGAVRYFAQIRGTPGARKGMVRVTL